MHRELGALHSSELMKLPHDPSDENDDIWQFSLQVRCLREQMIEFEEDLHKTINEQLCTLDGLLSWCDSLLYQSCELYTKRSESAKKDTPES